jgi:hypothetical protein
MSVLAETKKRMSIDFDWRRLLLANNGNLPSSAYRTGKMILPMPLLFDAYAVVDSGETNCLDPLLYGVVLLPVGRIPWWSVIVQLWWSGMNIGYPHQ